MKNPIDLSRAGARLRRGFTLVEMLTTLVILGIVGGALIKLIMVQARFSQTQMALRSARNVSRSAMNVMITDLRMVQDSGGLVVASPDSVIVRIPLAFGLVCSTSGGGVTLSLLPADSAMVALGVYAGYAIRDSASGLYSYTSATHRLRVTNLNSGLAATCTAAGISPITYGTRSSSIVTLADSPVGNSNVGWPAFIYQRVTYKFANSSAYPGRRGLWRLVATDDPSNPVADEIIAPFDASAKFRFYALNADAAQDTTPTRLSDVRGIELVLAGSSNEKLSNNAQAKQATMVTGVFFKNRRDP
jgi:prepilin-type N-terminal cleavage/methylation domain-containing protein